MGEKNIPSKLCSMYAIGGLLSGPAHVKSSKTQAKSANIDIKVLQGIENHLMALILSIEELL